MKKMVVFLLISTVCILGVTWSIGHYMRSKTRTSRSAIVQTQTTSISSLPHFALLNSERMRRNAASVKTACAWGKLIVYVNTIPQEFKDVKVWVGSKDSQAKEWDWNVTKTRHAPGIQPADLYEFIDQVDEIILTRGVERVLQIPQETIEYVKSKGKVCHEGETPDMIELFNRLVDQGKKVGGVFHSTC